MANYYIYFDSGTSNTRIYLLSEDMDQLYVNKRPIGSKDSAAAGSNDILLKNLKEMFDETLQAMNLTESDVTRIFASGMSTSPYGIKEIPHVVIPITVEEYAKNHPIFFEDRYFHRDIELVPGLKTIGDDISSVNNMRGEEIEIIGVIDHLPEGCEGKDVAMIMPGSHTHTALVKDGVIKDILSTFSGELFYALKESTVLAPVLGVPVASFDEEYVKMGFENLNKYGFNRAIYICHAMRVFNEATEEQRVSYAEGVIMGDIINALDYRCSNEWNECETAVVVCTDEIFELFKILLSQSKTIKKIYQLQINDQTSYAVEGLRTIIKYTK